MNAHTGGGWCEWSPDGESLLYPELVNGLARLRIVNVESSSVRTLQEDPFAELEAAGRHNVLTEGPAGGAWSRESGVLLGGPRLRLVSPETGAARNAVEADPKVELQLWPSFLPDGKSFVFSQHSTDAAKRGIFLGQIGSDTATRIVNVTGSARVTASGHLLFVHNSVLMGAPFDLRTRTLIGEPRSLANLSGDWFSVSPANALAVQSSETGSWLIGTLQVFDRAGVRKRQLGGEPDQYAGIQMSPDGRRLLVDTKLRFAVIDFQRGLLVPLGYAAQEQEMGSSNPTWIGDQDVVYTQYTRDDHRNLASINTVTGDQRILLNTEIARWPQAWSNHSHEIIAIKWEPDGTSLWAIPEASPRAGRRLSREGPYDVSQASLSADEHWLAYDSNETGAFEVYVRPFEGRSDRQRISSGGGRQPLWRHDGRELFYLGPDGSIMAVPMSSSMEPGEPVKLFTLGANRGFRQYAVLPDGQSFVALVPSEKQAAWSITVLTNWTALLSK